MGGIMVQDVIEEALVTAIVDSRKNAEGAIIELIGGHGARKSRQGPVKEVGVQARLRLFFPPPRPRAGSWHKGQRPGGRARGASWRDGKANHPRPRAARRGPSRGGCMDCPVGPEQRGRRSSTCDTAYSNAEN